MSPSKQVMVRYTLRPDRVSENQTLILAVFEQLTREHPDGIRYATFKQDDGVSFVHLASIETADGTNPLLALTAFKAFAQAIANRCVAPPVSVQLSPVGVYRLLS